MDMQLHITCSCTYVSDKSTKQILETDLNFFPIKYATISIDTLRKTVRSSFFGLGESTAVFKDGLGCMLLKGNDNHQVEFKTGKPTLRWNDPNINYPFGRKEPVLNLNKTTERVQNIVNAYFDKPGEFLQKTTAIVVMQGDSLIYENYASGISKSTPLIGWSMTKSITNALVGILIKQNRISLNTKFKETDWSDSISLHQLLQMNSGIKWEEDYSEVSDVTRMLYNSEKSSTIFQTNSSEFEPGTYWEYNSGTTNYISSIIQSLFDQPVQYHAFPYLELFNKIDAPSFTIECDESGQSIMSSYGYATARDWAKLGLLYLRNGKWEEEQIFPEGWVEYSTEPNRISENLKYGAHIWLNTNHNYFPDAPDDVYFFSGFQGQVVCIVPSLDAVIVRLGNGKNESFNMNDLISEICKVLS